MEARAEQAARRTSLFAAAVLILANLAAFNYGVAATQSLSTSLGLADAPTSVAALACLLPIGISFYSLQAIGYLVDVYYGRQQAERHLGIFAFFVAFFPQLVAGPIERAKHCCRSFVAYTDWTRIVSPPAPAASPGGSSRNWSSPTDWRSSWDQVFAHPDAYGWWVVLLAGLLFVIQLYCDFSGPTMARRRQRRSGARGVHRDRKPMCDGYNLEHKESRGPAMCDCRPEASALPVPSWSARVDER